jgi:hypothetical protein
MADMTPRMILDAVREGLEETSLLVALGYDATQGRPNGHLLNNVLELRGYGRPIDEQRRDRAPPYEAYPDEWIQAIARAVSGDANAPLREVVALLKQQQVIRR